MNIFDDASDEDLVRHSKAGDQHAFGILFLRYKVEVYKCIMKVIQNDDTAKDLWQETYIKAWRHIRDLKEPSAFKSWLRAIARNLALDQRRKDERRRNSSLEENINTLDSIDYEADPQILIESVMDIDRLRSILEQMEPVLQKVLLLHVNGFSRTEIAQKLGHTEGTVTTYLSRARKQFEQRYLSMDKTDDGDDKEQHNGQAHNASLPAFLDECNCAQESYSPNEDRKEI